MQVGYVSGHGATVAVLVHVVGHARKLEIGVTAIQALVGPLTYLLAELRGAGVPIKPPANAQGNQFGLLGAAYINLAWVGLGEKMVQWFSLSEEPSVWISFVLSMLVLALVMRKG